MIETFFEWAIDVAALLIDGMLRTRAGIQRGRSNRSFPRGGAEPARDTTGAGFDPIDYEVDMLLKAALQAELGSTAAGHSPSDRGRRPNHRRDH